MREYPFTADPLVAERIAWLTRSIGPAFSPHVMAALSDGYIVPRSAVDRLTAAFGLTGPREVMLLALPAATGLARPPVSDFRVGAVGLEAETGNLILGGNVEFPGFDMASTIHAEGFVFSRAFARDRSIVALATSEARPCGHCRQFISEFASSLDLDLIDPLGHSLSMADLYPWPFCPGDLGRSGIMTQVLPWPELAIMDEGVPRDVADLLARTGRRAHAPYSRSPAAVILHLADGRLIAGASIESVAFNPTIGPLQSAIVELIAHGRAYPEIERATLAITGGATVDHTSSTRALLASVAPGAMLTVTTWA